MSESLLFADHFIPSGDDWRDFASLSYAGASFVATIPGDHQIALLRPHAFQRLRADGSPALIIARPIDPRSDAAISRMMERRSAGILIELPHDVELERFRRRLRS